MVSATATTRTIVFCTYILVLLIESNIAATGAVQLQSIQVPVNVNLQRTCEKDIIFRVSTELPAAMQFFAYAPAHNEADCAKQCFERMSFCFSAAFEASAGRGSMGICKFAYFNAAKLECIETAASATKQKQQSSTTSRKVLQCIDCGFAEEGSGFLSVQNFKLQKQPELSLQTDDQILSTEENNQGSLTNTSQFTHINATIAASTVNISIEETTATSSITHSEPTILMETHKTSSTAVPLKDNVPIGNLTFSNDLENDTKTTDHGTNTENITMAITDISEITSSATVSPVIRLKKKKQRTTTTVIPSTITTEEQLLSSTNETAASFGNKVVNRPDNESLYDAVVRILSVEHLNFNFTSFKDNATNEQAMMFDVNTTRTDPILMQRLSALAENSSMENNTSLVEFSYNELPIHNFKTSESDKQFSSINAAERQMNFQLPACSGNFTFEVKSYVDNIGAGGNGNNSPLKTFYQIRNSSSVEHCARLCYRMPFCVAGRFYRKECAFSYERQNCATTSTITTTLQRREASDEEPLILYCIKCEHNSYR